MTLPPAAFGRALVASGDLDPVYLALKGAGLPPDHRARWCFAYWLFYHAGVASRLSEIEGRDFWTLAETNLGWPRGTERRHFRGENAVKALRKLAKLYPSGPAQAVDYVVDGNLVDHGGRALSFSWLRARVLQWPQFGPWIAFKVADMIDAVLDVPVDFSHSAPFWFEEPAVGAVIINRHWEGDSTGEAPKEQVATAKAQYEPTTKKIAIKAAALYLRDQLGGLKAPHAPERSLRMQEFETICCKYKSHLNGHYEVGKDTKELLHVLEDHWGPTARKVRAALAAATIDRMTQ